MLLRRIVPACSVTAFALVIAVSPATAKPKAGTFAGTFPVASKLCAKSDAAKLPTKLAASSDQVSAACATLRTGYAATLGTYNTSVTPLKQQASIAVATAKTSCASASAADLGTTLVQPSGGHAGSGAGAARPSAACRQARAAARTTLHEIRTQVKALTTTYRTSVKAERKTFWATIHSLRGGAAVVADPATSLPTPPAHGIPADATLA